MTDSEKRLVELQAKIASEKAATATSTAKTLHPGLPPGVYQLTVARATVNRNGGAYIVGSLKVGNREISVGFNQPM